MNKIIYAEDVNYFQTSKTHAETWVIRAKKEITNLPTGRVTGEAFMTLANKSVFVLMFNIGGDNYKVEWPVLQSRRGNDKAAKVQAATLLYHDVKHRCVLTKVFGAKTAFIGFLVLPDGKTINDSVEAIQIGISQPALASGVIEGEVVT